MCPFGIQSLVWPYQPFHEVLKTCCCTKACGLCCRSLWCSSCGSSVGALPYVRSRGCGDSALPLTKQRRASVVARARWGLCLARSRLKRFNGSLYLASPKDFLFPHITSAADMRWHPLLAGREQQNSAKYPPKSSDSESDTADDFILASPDWRPFMQCSQTVLGDGVNG